MRGCFLGLFLVAAIVVFLGAVAFALLAPTPTLPTQFTPVAVSTVYSVVRLLFATRGPERLLVAFRVVR